MIFDFVDFSPTIQALRGSNPPTANFFRVLCSVNLKQKVRGIFTLKTQKTGLGLAVIAIPKPVFSGFTVFWAISAPKARKLPDLSGGQIRQSIWQREKDSNPHKRSQSPVCYHYTNPLSARNIILVFCLLSILILRKKAMVLPIAFTMLVYQTLKSTEVAPLSSCWKT